MNSLGITLIWLAVQVTVITLAGLGLTILAARRAHGTGASAALTTLAATAVLAAMACCPLPSWWTWDANHAPAVGTPVPGSASEGRSSSEQVTDAAKSSSGTGVGLAALISVLRDLGLSTGRASLPAGFCGNWPAVVAAVAATGTALGVLRLLFGLLAIRRGWLRSRPVEEPGMFRLVEKLRSALGVSRPVVVREWADLTTAATVGWRKPVLFLPGDWRDWTPDQQRAVVAHELVHIARCDFASNLLAQLSLILHFWHPLVRLLVRRLHLQQELAADAVAAPLAGGRPGYLRTLAELALRSDGRAHGWPAPALLSLKGTLLRRVEMLRIGEGVRNRPLSRTGRRLAVCLICALTLTVSALRGPVQQTLAEPSAPTAKPVVAQVVPFDLSLLRLEHDKEAAGAFGIRPAAILNRPSMVALHHLIDGQVDLLTQPQHLGDFGIHVEDVEQVMGRVYIKGENKPGKRQIMLGLNVMRTTRDMDWVKLRDKSGLKMKQYQWKGETYVSVAGPPFLAGITGVKGDAYLWAVDKRTLIIDTESAIKTLIEARASGRKPVAPDYAAGWDRVSRGLFALVLDNRGQRLTKASITEAERKKILTKQETLEYHILRFCNNASQLVIGCAGADDFRVDLWASADTPARAAGMERSCEEILAVAKKMLADEQSKAADSNNDKAFVLEFDRKLLNGAVVHREGTVVTVHANVASGLNALLAQYAKGATQSVGE